MMEETRVRDTNTKTQLSLAAALFFSPLVQNMLSNKNRDITDQEREFIRWYIKYGYITLFFWCITIGAGVMNYLFSLNILNIVYTVSIFILLLLLIVSIVSILSDINLLKATQHTTTLATVEWGRKNILLKYIPFYNSYLWYDTHSFDKPNWRIKESLLWWMLIFAISMLWSTTITTILLILFILRVASLMSDIDVLSITAKQRLTQLFLKNPEEIRWYLSGTIVYLAKNIKKIIIPSLDQPSLHNEIAKEKEKYSRIIDIYDHTLLWEYILWILLTIGLVYFIHPDFTLRTYYLGLWLFCIRYVVMWIQLEHLPHLPIARELVALGQRIYHIIKK